MALREDIEKQGKWLFKWRSYFPLLFLPLLLVALKNSEHLERKFGIVAQECWSFFCIAVSFFGLAIRAITIACVPRGTSGRNAQWQVAESLNTTGMYSVMRHPVYFGNFVIMLGIILFSGAWWFAVVALLGFWWYYERIMFAEEEFLRNKFGDAFLEWAKKTPAFFPKFKNWKKPSLDFSLKTVLRKEFSTFFGIVTFFAFLNIARNFLIEGKLKLSLPWMILLISCIVISTILRILKRKTKILHVEGR